VPQRIHASVDQGVMAMDGYAFGAPALELAQALQPEGVAA
jgi:hypothetical protein